MSSTRSASTRLLRRGTGRSDHAGGDVPHLVQDEPTRNAAWDKFRAHPDWQRIKNLPEYAYTATRNTSLLLSPLPYSQI